MKLTEKSGTINGAGRCQAVARITSKGIEKYMKQLQELNGDTDDVCKAGVFAGAKVMGDKIKAAIDTIPIRTPPPGKEQFHANKAAGEFLEGLTPEQAEDLKKGFGIAAFNHENYAWNTKIGFNGYNRIKTKAHPDGQPNAMIARSLESGTSIRIRTPFVEPTVKSGRKETEQAMEDAVSKKVSEIMKK